MTVGHVAFNGLLAFCAEKTPRGYCPSPKEGQQPEAGSELGFCSNPGFSFAGALVLKVNHIYLLLYGSAISIISTIYTLSDLFPRTVSF